MCPLFVCNYSAISLFKFLPVSDLGSGWPKPLPEQPISTRKERLKGISSLHVRWTTPVCGAYK